MRGFAKIGLLLVLACTGRQEQAPSAAARRAPVLEGHGRSDGPTMPPDATLGLRRAACFGPCPIYEVTLSATGAVTYREDPFGVERSRFWRVDPLAVATLWNDLEPRLTRLTPVPHEVVPCFAFHQPSTTLTLRRGGDERSIRERGFCSGYGPYWKELRAMAARVDAVAGTPPLHRSR